MTDREAAEFLGISIRSLKSYTAQGKLHPRYHRIKSGHLLIYDKSELFKFQEELKCETKPADATVDSSQKGRPSECRAAEHQLSANVWNILVCPCCGQSLEKTAQGAACHACQMDYGYTGYGSLDLRLKKRKTYHLDFQLPATVGSESGPDLSPSSRSTPPEIDQSGGSIAYETSEWWSKSFPKARSKGSMLLDLGCGSVIERELCEQAGFEYVAVDYDSPHAHILGDAHSLPFKENSFDCILSVAVLEHVRFPFVVMREAYRVLKPGGKFIGTVAFLEPFHDNSFYHHSHLGLFNSLQYGGFRIEHIVPSGGWSVLAAQAYMALFPGMPTRLSRSLVAPLQFLHRLWWRVRRMNEDVRIRTTTGAFCFAATKD